MKRALATLALTAALAPPAHAYRDREVKEAVRKAGFPALADRAARAARPALVLGRTRTTRMPAALGTSRYGGLPDLPPGEPWPQCAGRPQTFLAQVRLGELPPGARELRRHGGVLLFFTDVEFEDETETIVGLEAGRCTTVVHAPDGAQLRRTPRPRGQMLPVRPARMRFGERADLPDVVYHGGRLSPPMRGVSLPSADQDRWSVLREGLLGRPRLEHKLLGHLENVNGEVGRCWWNTQRRRGAWRHLFTMGYDEAIRFEVSDGGRLQIQIAPGDLRRGRFDRVCGIFDSA